MKGIFTSRVIIRILPEREMYNMTTYAKYSWMEMADKNLCRSKSTEPNSTIFQ